MNLKKAYRYQAYLAKMYRELCDYCIANSTILTELHKKSVMPQAEDVTVTRSIDNSLTDVENNIDSLIAAMGAVISEKCRVNNYIAEAKSRAEIDIDSAVMNNKLLYGYIEVLENIQSKNKRQFVQDMKQGSGYVLNNDGNQVQYTYSVDYTFKPSYNQADVNKTIAALKEDCDGISDKIEKAEVGTELSDDFKPMFGMNDSIDVVLSKIRAAKQ